MLDPLTKFRSDRTRIAIVGSAFRMPGVGNEGFWEALIAGRDLVSSVEAQRWSQDPYLHPLKSAPGAAYTFAAGSIGDVSGFDAAFFGISPREAEQMDPQQRVLLEMVWEAFENAGIRPSVARGAGWGVYVGLASVDYAYRRADDLGSIDATTMTGSTGSIAANRISYLYDLRGPSMTIDTACSSSLVALHQACQSIRHGESEAAVVGGISLHLHPYGFVGFSKASMLSRSGRCRPFAEDGDGYVRSEGGAVVLLKPLARAIADGDRIQGVIIETGVNNDGRKSGLTVPSQSAQAALLTEVYDRAGIDPREIDYLEAHGTGTPVGDPIEACAIGEALGRRRPSAEPLPIGSVKSHVGHLEAASGMAGLMKVLEVLRHRRVPANIHLEKPSSQIDFAGLNLAPVAAPLDLDATRRLVVGVSAFGFGGTNAHAVLTSFEIAPQRNREDDVAPPAPLMLSARSPAALQASARKMARFLRERPDLSDYDIAYSAAFARDVHPYRLSSTGGQRALVAEALDRFAEGGAAPGIVTGQLRRDASAPAFVFSGNGSQWVGMGLQLLDEEPAFRETLEEIDVLFGTHSNRSVIADLRAAPIAGGLERTEIAQPALFAVQVGVTRLFERMGIRPVAVCGHSVGEIAAAWASGALTLEAAVRVVYERSAHQAPTRGSGAMAAVELSDSAASALLDSLGLSDKVVVAAINADHGVTLAGDESALAQIGTVLARRRIRFRRLALDYAFHSPAMDGIRAGLLGSLADLAPEAGEIPFYSTVTGGLIDGAAIGAEYWWSNVRKPVRFQQAIRAMLAAGINTFVEVGPRPVVACYITDIAKIAGIGVFTVASLTPNEPGGARIRAVAHQLELSGALHNPIRLFPVAGKLVELPPYAWQRERYWQPGTCESLGLLERRCVHPLLGYALPGEELQWENHLDTTKFPAFADHVVAGATVFPAAGFVEMALAAAAERFPGRCVAIEDLEILAPLLLDAEHAKILRLRLRAEDGSFVIVSRDRERGGDWRTHVVGRLIEEPVPAAAPPLSVPQGQPDVSAAAHYGLAESIGLHYGPAFRCVTGAWLSGGALIGSLTAPAGVAEETRTALLHPAYLDGAFQLLLDLAGHERADGAPASAGTQAFLPVRIDRLELLQPHRRVAAARATPGTARHRARRALHADFTLYDELGAPVAIAHRVRFRAVSLQRTALEAPNWIATRVIPRPRRESRRALRLPSPLEAARICAERLHAPARASSRMRFAHEVEPLLDALCAAFAERALHELAGEDALDPSAWEATGRITRESGPLARYLLQLLAEEGVVQAVTGAWQWTLPAGERRFPAPEDIWNTLIADYPEYAPIIARAGAAGLRLGEQLRTGASAAERERRLQENATAWADACTQEEAVAVFRAIQDVLAAMQTLQPIEARLRVLYISGALPAEEVGFASWPSLDRDRCDVLIAATSRHTLDDLRARYPAVAALPGQVLELDRPGLEALEALGGRFDVIVLSEGLAGASDAAVRVDNLRGLLFDDGLLFIIGQHASRADDLSFGLSRSWWQLEPGSDGAVVRSRLRAPQGWEAILGQSGFRELQTVGDVPEATAGPYLLIARAESATTLDEPLVASEPAAHRTWIIVRDASGYSSELAHALALALEECGQTLVTVTAATAFSSEGAKGFTLDPTSREHWARLLGELQRAAVAPDAWVHLAGLDLATGGASLEARAAAQALRASVLMAWLQASARSALRPDCWVIAAQASLSLLPAGRSGALPVPADRVRDAALWGLTRVAMQEFADTRVRWVDLADPLPCGMNASALARELLRPDGEDEVFLTAAGRFVPRIRLERALPAPAPEHAATAGKPDARVQLDFSAPGPFRNLTWRRDPPPCGAPAEPLDAGELEIDVRAAGLNFRDVMYAMGLLPDEAIEDGFCGPNLGMELAGVVRRTGPGVDLAPGDEVIAIAPASFANRARTRAFAVIRKPADWSFAAAATVPTAFFTAYYALAEIAKLEAGERVLIHGAAGGVGIAAIQIARHLGAEIFVTAGTAEKRDFVRLLGADAVFDSRSLTFADEVLHATAGAGVDVVLNSLAGEAMRRNLRLLRPFGRMIELGKRDFYENSRLGLRPFRNNIAYFGLDADQLIAHKPEVARRVLEKLMRLFAEGVLHPLPHRAFSATEVEAAFRHMQSSHHIGKIVITFPRDFAPPESPPADRPEYALRAEATYLVTGGLSGFGLRTAWWLVQRGARHLALLSRRGAATADAAEALRLLSAAGVTVRAIACDVANAAELEVALAGLADMPPLRGIVHAAMVIEDALIRDMDRGQLERVLAPKIGGALRLHQATRARELDFFLLYSSATTSFGNPGQGAYVAANMALEALAGERRALGLAATCVSWGPIGDAGYLARNERVREALVGRLGGRALSAEEALRSLDALLTASPAATSVPLGLLELDWRVLSRFLPAARAPKFSELAREEDSGGAVSEGSAQDLRRSLAALPHSELLPALTDLVRRAIAQILRIAPERIEPAASLFDIGMDSLMAVELASSIESRLAIQISALALTDAPTVERIAARLAQQLRPADRDSAGEAQESDLAEEVRLLTAQHASEMSEEMASEFAAEIRGSSAPVSLTARQRS